MPQIGGEDDVRMISIMKHLNYLEKIDRNRILKCAVGACIVILALQYYLVGEQLMISFEQKNNLAVVEKGDGRYGTIVQKGWGVKCFEGENEIRVKIDNVVDLGKTLKIAMETHGQNEGLISCSETRELTIFRYLYDTILKR